MKKLYEEENIQDIANSIRNKNGTQTLYTTSDMAAAIDELVVEKDYQITDGSYLFFSGARINALNELLEKCKGLTSTRQMFAYCDSLITIPQIDTSNVTDMYYMFSGCTSLTTIPNLDTSNATEMSNLFYGCRSLTSVPSLNTSKATNLTTMFSGCTSLTSIPKLNISNATNITGLLSNCSGFETLDFSGWDLSNVVHMGSVFNNCKNLVNLNVDDLNLKNVTEMDYMFGSCPRLSNASLNSIMKMCSTAINAKKKTLKTLYITSSQAEICTTLSNYQMFLNAGWTTGY